MKTLKNVKKKSYFCYPPNEAVICIVFVLRGSTIFVVKLLFVGRLLLNVGITTSMGSVGVPGLLFDVSSMMSGQFSSLKQADSKCLFKYDLRANVL